MPRSEAAVLRVRDLMTTDVERIESREDLNIAQAMMALGRFHHLQVVDGQRLVGILSWEDICRSKASDVRSALTLEQLRAAYERISVRDIMSDSPHTVSPDAPAAEAAAVLRQGGFSALPVVDNNELVGMVTTSDLLDAFIRSEFMERSDASAVIRAKRDSQVPWADPKEPGR